LPVRIDGIEMLEIGAGGGSIARIDEAGWLSVGPDSAGSVPGPACYGRGGEQPTVTDANLILGYFDPDGFAGGAMRLFREQAAAALADLGQRLSVGVEEVAASILDLVNAQMASAVRVHIIERGGDPEKGTIIAFGGGGPLHAYEVARLVGCRRIIVPPRAGVASAIGLLLTPPAIERSLALHHRVGDDDNRGLLRAISGLFDAVQAELRERYRQVRAVDLMLFAEMLYVGQGHEIVFQLPRGVLDSGADETLNERLRQAFETEYAARGLHPMPSMPVLMTRITLRGALDRFVDRPPGIERSVAGPSATGRRGVYFPEAKDQLEVKVLARAEIVPGLTMAGPVLIEEAETTTVVGPSAEVRLDPQGNLVIDMFSRTVDRAGAG
jgi:N-methylhydantoinase A